MGESLKKTPASGIEKGSKDVMEQQHVGVTK